MIEHGMSSETAQHVSQAVFGLYVLMAFSMAQRKIIFKRAQGKCENGVVVGDEPCDKEFYEGYMLHAHHVKPLHMGGRDDTANGTLLCIEHHAQAHLDLYEEHGKIEDKVAYNTLMNTDPYTIHYHAANDKDKVA